MPIYEFRCQTCGTVSELLFQSLHGDEELECRQCGSQNLQRLLSAPNLMKERAAAPGHTCCGRTERCEKPPCSSDGGCHRG